ncbi:hypothetical protein MMC30_001447 [Trapelia coarctata]|nr:hypothetical protein [Trapelia coarctata]
MSWKEVSPGRFERPFGFMEIFFRAIAAPRAPLKKEHLAISIVAQFHRRSSVEDTVTDLKNAWKTMRYDHPEIASFADGNNKVYEVADDATAESWISRTFMVEVVKTADDLFASFRPSEVATCYYLPQTSEIMIHTSHWRLDGVGALCLLHNFFTALAKPRGISFGTEAKNLSPSLDEAADFCMSTTADEDEAATRLVMEYIGNLPSIGLPAELNEGPCGTRRVELVLSSDVTSSIVAACKVQDVTVTTAVHAAIVVATQQLAPAELSACNYTFWGSINFRPYLMPPYDNSNAHPASVYMVGLPVTMVPSGFSENASNFKQFYKRCKTPTESNFHGVMAPWIRKSTALLDEPAPPERPAATEPMLSSVGVADRYLAGTFGDTVEVTNFWLGVEMLSKQIDCFLWTWQGRMSLHTCYNEQFYKADFVKQFSEKVKGVLLKELDISST